MKCPVFIILSALLCTAILQAEPRTFTNTEGKSIKAELVSVEGENAVLKLANLSVAKVPLTSLSKADEAYVKAWWEENKNNIGPMDIRLAIDKNTERIDRKSSRSGGNGGGGNNRNNQFSQVVTKMQKDEIQYACVLKSYVKKDISDITVDYTIYKRTSTKGADGSDTIREKRRANVCVLGHLETGLADLSGLQRPVGRHRHGVVANRRWGLGQLSRQRDHWAGLLADAVLQFGPECQPGDHCAWSVRKVEAGRSDRHDRRRRQRFEHAGL